ncbi:MAG: agmatine deiminase family protein [Taibaiella sp.]|nr:agmatine deiminase family protein [Taibaiella sp.]
MITDQESNFLYLADSIKKGKYQDFSKRFENLLIDSNINYDWLIGTKDIWAVDFMPIQINENEYIQFEYKPDYLYTKAELNSISNVEEICERIGIKVKKSDLIIDGGNVVKAKNKVILCDKVIFANQNKFSRKEIVRELHNLFQVEKIFFVPQDPSDIIGHADGMIRFIDDNHLIVNDYNWEHEAKNRQFVRAFYIALDNIGIEYETLPYNPYSNRSTYHANGIYINYLQMNNLIVLPSFGFVEDEIAKNKMSVLFPQYKIETIDSSIIALNGGVLNCITWNIYT